MMDNFINRVFFYTYHHQVAPSACGHPVCGPCFEGIVLSAGGGGGGGGHRASYPCPVCRETAPVKDWSPLPLLGAVAKADRPGPYQRRKQEQAEVKLERLRKRYASRVQQHPLAALLEWQPGVIEG